MGRGNVAKNKRVLVGVLKNKRDLSILLEEKWYRMPVVYAPKKSYQYIAFYQPAAFGKEGGRIEYYAEAQACTTTKRKRLLPDEPAHPRADADYFKIYLKNIRKLSIPIKNTTPRRVSFGFTTLGRLLSSRNILQLYNVVPTEEIVAGALRHAGVEARAQYTLKGKRRYRLDFAVFCKRGAIAVECDNKKAHGAPLQRKKDKTRDAFLRRNGWKVLRFQEKDIVVDVGKCVARVEKLIRQLN